MAGWASDAAAYRAAARPARDPLTVPARATRSICFPATATARSSSSSMAATGRRWTARSSAILPRGLNAHGIGVAIPSYDLCPDVTRRPHHRADADGRARTGAARPAAGRSAAIPPAGILPPACWRPTGRRSMRRCRRPRDRGLRHFRPVRSCAAGRDLDQQGAAARSGGGARAASPLFWKPPARGSLDAVVGENESAEYFRQSRTIVDAGARRASRPGSARLPAPIISPRSRRSPTRLADGAAAEGTGGTLVLYPREKSAGWPDLGPCAKLL